jgi:aminodeoxyfutalosine deaminase
MVRGIRARRILTMVPGSACIEDGLLLFDEQGTILAVGPHRALKGEYQGPVEDLGPVTLVPGLINAHSHLEISQAHLRTLSGQGFEPWVRSLLALPLHQVTSEDVSRAVDQLKACGTAHVADITSRAPSLVAATLEEQGIGVTLLVEFIGFKNATNRPLDWPVDRFSQPPRARICAAGHALYSTAPQLLQQAKAWDVRNNLPFSLHLAEHTGEVEFLATGRGTFGELLMQRRLVPRDYAPPGLSPVSYANRLGLLDDCTLAVHCVHLSGEDIDTLAGTGTNVCLCPRSNAMIGVGRSPWEKMLHADITLCLGTDSLASNEDLNLWNEALFLLRHTQTPLSLLDLLSMLTVNPARALGLSRLGSLRPGNLARYAILPLELEPLSP